MVEILKAGERTVLSDKQLTDIIVSVVTGISGNPDISTTPQSQILDLPMFHCAPFWFKSGDALTLNSELAESFGIPELTVEELDEVAKVFGPQLTIRKIRDIALAHMGAFGKY